jgi:hypothetical protein
MGDSPHKVLELPELLGLMRDDERKVIALIDTDPKLKRRSGGRNGDLVIANARDDLHRPEKLHLHQMLAKGIVYRKATLEVVSLPLVKMFNHDKCPASDAVTRQIIEHGGYSITFPEKLDGTMIQLFDDDGIVCLGTRSTLEGSEESPQLELARSVLRRDAPHLLSPGSAGPRTLVFELVHPQARQITRYGARESMVLVAVYDRQQWRYWKTADVIAFAENLNLERPTRLIADCEAAALESGIERLRAALAGNTALPEGSVVCFEDDVQILHRVKVKMEAYLLRMSARSRITLKTVAQVVWHQPELHNWEAYRRQVAPDEELETLHKEHHDVIAAWLSRMKARHRAAETTVSTFENEKDGRMPESDKERIVYLKSAAQWCKSRCCPEFGLVMQRIRQGSLALEDVMLTNPIYPGFCKDVASRRRHREGSI